MGDPGRLVGRAAELSALTGVVVAAATGRGGLAVVEGEAGIGKTALVTAALHRAGEQGLTCHRATAREIEGHRPFGVVSDALGVRPDSAQPRAREIAALLTGRAGTDWASTQYRVEEALLDLVDDLTKAGPAVLVAEDLHWADPASLTALGRIARATATLPLSIIWTHRPLPRRPELYAALPDHALRLPLGPLSPEDVAALAGELAGAEIGANLRTLLAGAGGNPLFVREVMTDLVADGTLTTTQAGTLDTAATGRLPSLSVSVLGHLSTLDPATTQLLGIAAVLGSAFSVAALARVTGQPVGALWPALSEALAAQVLTEDGDRLMFRHDLIRDAFYDDLPAAVRTALHAEAARVLERTGAASATVAGHVLRSSGADAAAADRLRRAAADAVAAGAPAVAADLLRTALATAPDDVTLRAELGLALVAAGRPVDAETLLRGVLAAGTEPAQEAAVRAALQQSLTVQGRVAEALTEAEAGASSPALVPAHRARFAARASMARLFVGDVDGAQRAATEAEAAALAAADVPARVRAILTQAHVASTRARWHAACEHADRAIALVHADDSLETHESLPHHVHTQVLTGADDFAGALAAATEAQRAAERLGLADGVVTAHLVRGTALFSSGSWDEAVVAYETALTLADETGTAWQVEALACLTLIRCWQGHRQAAAALFARAEQAIAAGQPRFRPGWTEWAASALAESRGRPDEATDLLLPPWTLCVRHGVAAELRVLGPHLASVATTAGRRSVAAEVAAALGLQARANPDHVGLAADAAYVRGLATGDPNLLVEALQLHRKGDRPHARARCAEAAAVVLARRSSIPEARSVAQEAVILYSELGADGELSRARAAWRQAGLRLGVRGPRRRPTHGWAALTDTEVEVARLVAQRLSNPEIAERMFLSRRTVGTHVSHLLGKLGMSSRSELVAAAARGPLEQLGEHSQ